MRPITLFDVSRQRVKTGTQVDIPDLLPATNLSPRQMARMDRAAKLLLLAAHEAWTQSGWAPSENLPLVLGTTSGGMNLGEAFYRQAMSTPRNNRRQASRVQG